MKVLSRKCQFCGEEVKPGDKECPKCGWDLKPVKAGPEDPGVKRARLVVSIVMAIGFIVMYQAVQELEEPTAAIAAPLAAELPAQQPESVVIDSGTPPVPSIAAALVSVKGVDEKSRVIQGREAINYQFDLPETDQNCKLQGLVRATGGDTRGVEVYLLAADDFALWRMNPVAVPRTAWAPARGSEVSLNYQLADAGSYYLVISNAMSPRASRLQVKAQVKCTRDTKPG